ncbi:hypothetical protein CEP52_000650 [Fusarium oligoseptatum]|uniref:Pyroglutamyl-peptidase 1 n=1 Tax=Fusarium oligoseptatum TaxID=2604345 RepID=A0A428UMR8_9HYPO|nr:hypothetical protein CEP52_000650 [Fusarium oligoseptatum]
MGSQIGDPDELTVLVTGFGPFREQYPINPSWEIASGLPSHLPPLRAKNPDSRHAAVALPKVRILVHPEPIRVNYRVVRDLVPTRGHRDGYKHTDVDGERPDEEEERKPGGDWPWRGLPEEIETELDVEDILARWQGHSSKDMDLRISEDAGRYLCDFIYYSSLAELWKLQRPRKVVFLHVPADASHQSIEKGRELAVNLVRSIIESEVDKSRQE